MNFREQNSARTPRRATRCRFKIRRRRRHHRMETSGRSCPGLRRARVQGRRPTRFVGKLCVFRVLQGTLGGEQPARGWIDDGKRACASAHVFKVQGTRPQAETKRDHRGRYRRGGEDRRTRLRRDDPCMAAYRSDQALARSMPNMPKPMFGLAIEGTSKGAETKLGEALKQDDGRGSHARGGARAGHRRNRAARPGRAAPSA
jgi:hypothetical protein